MSTNPAIRIYIPQLFDPLPDWKNSFGFEPETSVLNALLSSYQSIKLPYSGLLETLYGSLGDGLNSSFPPHAVNCYQYDMGITPDEHVLLATPIYLQSGMTDVVVDGNAVTDLTEDEKNQLLDLMNKHFQQDNIKFEVSESGNWYALLSAEKTPDTTFPVHEVLGNSLYPFLHQSSQLEWNRLLNELQMLLYSSPVNQNRAIQGKREVSSFWLWGNDKTDNQYTLPTFRGVVSGGGFNGKVVSHAMGAKWQASLTAEEDAIIIANELLEPALCNDIEGWQLALADIEKNIIQPIISENNPELIIYTCDGRSWTKKDKWYSTLFRQKQKSLHELVHQSAQNACISEPSNSHLRRYFHSQ